MPDNPETLKTLKKIKRQKLKLLRQINSLQSDLEALIDVASFVRGYGSILNRASFLDAKTLLRLARDQIADYNEREYLIRWEKEETK